MQGRLPHSAANRWLNWRVGHEESGVVESAGKAVLGLLHRELLDSDHPQREHMATIPATMIIRTKYPTTVPRTLDSGFLGSNLPSIMSPIRSLKPQLGQLRWSLGSPNPMKPPPPCWISPSISSAGGLFRIRWHRGQMICEDIGNRFEAEGSYSFSSETVQVSPPRGTVPVWVKVRPSGATTCAVCVPTLTVLTV